MEEQGSAPDYSSAAGSPASEPLDAPVTGESEATEVAEPAGESEAAESEAAPEVAPEDAAAAFPSQATAAADPDASGREEPVQTETLAQFAARVLLPVNVVRDLNADRIDDAGNITADRLRLP